MKECFDQELTDNDARLTREWLMMKEGKPFFAYIRSAIQRHHDGSLNALTDNPIKDILMGRQEGAAEQALVHLLDAVDEVIQDDPDS